METVDELILFVSSKYFTELSDRLQNHPTLNIRQKDKGQKNIKTFGDNTIYILYVFYFLFFCLSVLCFSGVCFSVG